MALTVGMGTVLDSREAVVAVTGLRKSMALSKAIEDGVNHSVHGNLFHISIIRLLASPPLLKDSLRYMRYYLTIW